MTWHSSEPTVTILLAVAKPVFDATTVIGPLRSYTPAYVQSGGPKVVSGVTSVPMWTMTFASQTGPFGPMTVTVTEDRASSVQACGPTMHPVASIEAAERRKKAVAVRRICNLRKRALQLLYQPSLWLNHLARSRILPCSTDFLAPRS